MLVDASVDFSLDPGSSPGASTSVIVTKTLSDESSGDINPGAFRRFERGNCAKKGINDFLPNTAIRLSASQSRERVPETTEQAFLVDVSVVLRCTLPESVTTSFGLDGVKADRHVFARDPVEMTASLQE